MDGEKLSRNRIIIVALLFSAFLLHSTQALAETEVTDSILLVKSRLYTNRIDKTRYMDVAIRNTAAESLPLPATAVIDSISGTQVTIANADGTTDEGKPYFRYAATSGDGGLEPGATSGQKRWIFNNPASVRFSYSVKVYAGAGDSVPPDMRITNPLPQSVISDATPFLTVNYSDADSGIDVNSFQAQLNGEDIASLFSVSGTAATLKVSSALESGANFLSVAISDTAGNTAAAESNFTVQATAEKARYLFSVSGNNWIFASPGDGTCRGFLDGGALGLSDQSDIAGLSRVFDGGDFYFSLLGTGDIRRSSADGSNSVMAGSGQLGLTEGEHLIATHVGLDGAGYFAIDGLMEILRSEGDGANAYFMEDLEFTNPINCLHIGYDNAVYFCGPEGLEIVQAKEGVAEPRFLTAAELGVPGSTLNAFAFLPETTPPVLNITAPMNGAFLGSTTPAIGVAFSDAESGIDPASFYAEINGTDRTDAFTVTGAGAAFQVGTDSPLPVGDNRLRVKIRDRLGNESEATSDFTIGILRAVPAASPVSGGAPLTVHFTTDGEDPEGTIEVFRWDFYGDGSWDTYDTVARDYTRTYNTPGTYEAKLYAQSSTGRSATATVTINVQNNPPTAGADLQPSNGQVPLTVSLTGTGSDPDGSIALYEWDFDGDGTYDWSSATTGNTVHTYTAVGTFDAVFRVTDNSGLTATAHAATTVVRIGLPGSPTALAAVSPSSGNAPLAVSFNGTATDPDGDVVLYEWDFDGDGNYDWSSQATGNTSHTYSTAGTHVPALRVTDATGLTGTDQALVTVNIQTSLSVGSDTVGYLKSSSEIGTAAASSQYSSSYPPTYAVDGSTGTRWYAGYRASGPGSWFEARFKRPQLLKGFSVDWGSYSYRMTRARIEVFNAGGDILYSAEKDFGAVTTASVSFPQVENAAGIRLVTITSAHPYYLSIRELTIDSVPMSSGADEATGTSILTSLSAGSRVSILIKDAAGEVVRTLVNNTDRQMGNYSDYWNCKDDGGIVVDDGVYYAILQHVVDGKVETLDLTNSTGGSQFNPSRQSTGGSYSNPAQSRPFEDHFLPVNFSLNRAAEVTLFVGTLQGTNTRIRTIHNRVPMPSGAHQASWDGLDDSGNVAEPPPGVNFILGIWGYTLPDNAICMTGGKPEISQPKAEPNYFSPFSEKCDAQGNGEGVVLSYSLSEDVSAVELRVYSLETGSLVRKATRTNISAGDNAFFWDGTNDNGEYPDIGDYQLGLIAIDENGHASIMKYTLVRIDY